MPHIFKSFLTIGALTIAIVAIGQVRQNQSDQLANNLFLASIAGNQKRFTINEATAAVIFQTNDHNQITCSSTNPLSEGSVLSATDGIHFFVYEYTGDEPPFLGDFAFSSSMLKDQPLLAIRNTLDNITAGYTYYIRTDRDLVFDCNTGILNTIYEYGNGVVEGEQIHNHLGLNHMAEQCDDGNTDDGDGCSATGQETDPPCTTQGGFMGPACCNGLSVVSNSIPADLNDTNSECIPDDLMICINCGNNNCETGENRCNCAADCAGDAEQCVDAGETLMPFAGAPQCCDGLNTIIIANKVNGECTTPPAPPGLSVSICSNCGNGTCEVWENECNCIKDCPPSVIADDDDDAMCALDPCPSQQNNQQSCLAPVIITPCNSALCQSSSQCFPVKSAPACPPFICDNGDIFPRCDEDGDPIIYLVDPCSPIVKDAVCGNGKKEGNEECDDGNDNNIDQCDNKCKKVACFDSDGGKAYDKFGFIIREGYGGFKDYCVAQLGDRVLSEAFCDDEKGIVSYEQVTCPSICRDGVCLSSSCEIGKNGCVDGSTKSLKQAIDLCNECNSLKITHIGSYWKDEITAQCKSVDSKICSPNSDYSRCVANPICSTINSNCGNGKLEYFPELFATEECDDGNKDGGDGCNSKCMIVECGDGIVDEIDESEECDDGNLTDGDGCDSECKKEFCGDGKLKSDEECDDGNTINGDGCDETCLISECTNGRVEGGEECDDGNQDNDDACNNSCKRKCGDGNIAIGEECDDGNSDDRDGCSNNCMWESRAYSLDDCNKCGQYCGYQYGMSNSYSAMQARCNINSCKKIGSYCVYSTHQADMRSSVVGRCSSDPQLCPTPGRCGDGSLSAWNHEQCDDGNNIDGDGCDKYCMKEFCGNYRLDVGEECDDGNADDSDTCTNNCVINEAGVKSDPVCGNYVRELGEECDDGRTKDGDGCAADCKMEDITALCQECLEIMIPSGERTSDHEKANRTMCENTNSVCTYDYDKNKNMCIKKNVCKSLILCGNGALDNPTGFSHFEQCDDNNKIDGDGCNSKCWLEECGNGRVDEGEDCDDSNLNNTNDSCTTNCEFNYDYCDGIGKGTSECPVNNKPDGHDNNDLIAYYKLDEGSGNSIKDSSTSEFTGSMINNSNDIKWSSNRVSVSFTNSKSLEVGASAMTLASDAGVIIPNKLPETRSDVTMSFWVKTDQIDGTDALIERPVVQGTMFSENFKTSDAFAYQVYIMKDGTLLFNRWKKWGCGYMRTKQSLITNNN
ncbi:DUF4215 domain-containing protein, partial [Patescibacteria group bacterium]|nr:DUF4215 domain-containing protein [Patescibacteria group bacterium]